MTSDVGPNVQPIPGAHAGVRPRREVRDEEWSAESGVLGRVRTMAIVTLAVMLASRALLPGLRGSVVGISDLIDAGDFVTGVATQLAAILLLGLLFGLCVRVARARAPLALRVALIILGALGALGAMGSMIISRAPLLILCVVALATSAVGIVAGLDALRRPEVGLPALAAVLSGAASLVRAVGAFVTDRASDVAKDVESIVGAYGYARLLATASLGLAAAGLRSGAVWVVRRSRVAGAAAVAGAVAITAAIVTAAAATPNDLDATWVVVARRSVQHLVTRPPPHLPDVLPMAAVVFAPLLAVVAVVARRAPPALAGGIALTLLAGDAADIPLLGLSLACGALALVVVGRDPRGVFAALDRAR